MIKIYGIKNCDTMKKAFKWLDDQGVQYQFHDYRVEGLSEALLQSFIDGVGLEVLINKRSTTWRNLDKTLQDQMQDKSFAVDVLLKNPTLIKRPLLINKGNALVGFTKEDYEKLITH